MPLKRKLFCEISPITYKISEFKCRIIRHTKNLFKRNIAKQRAADKLPFLIYSHNSLIRRKLGNVDQALQDNKAISLGISSGKVNGVLIKPGQEFSFWTLVGSCTKRKGYKEGLVIKGATIDKEIGGGMCQFTNLIHWMILHTPLTIIEHHHHDGYDLFPDFGRTVPFGLGTSIMYNYLDYRFKNTTNSTYQVIVCTTNEYLCGEIRCDTPSSVKYHITVKDEYFSEEDGVIYRNNRIERTCIDKQTGNTLQQECIKTNHAKVLYDRSFITEIKVST